MNEIPHFGVIGTKERLVDQVVREIQQLILDHKLSPGMKLPPERELAEQFGVSRTVIREAVHVLVTRGLLLSRRKLGTLVRPLNQSLISEPLHILLQSKGFTLEELHQVRSFLEGEITELAAKEASQEEIDRLRTIVETMEAVLHEPEAYAAADAEFHHCLAGMTHNSLLVLLSDTIADLLQNVRLSIAAAPGLFVSAAQDHRKILDQIASHNAIQARKAMLAHLNHARQIQEQFLAVQDHHEDGKGR
jgi:GntR family transcriptional repressor for pyruvate dehydrogenase complex